MIIETIKSCRKQRKLIAVGKRVHDFYRIGYITQIMKEYFILHEVDILGQFQKKSKILFKEVTVLTLDDSYNANIELLHKKAKNLKAKPKYFKFDKNPCNYLETIRTSRTICSIFLGKVYYIGRIVDYDNDTLKIISITKIGLEDGETLLPVRKITSIRVNSKVELGVQLSMPN